MTAPLRFVLGFAVVVAIFAPIACSDDVGPFQPAERPSANDSIIRLTYSAADDHTPAWSANSDTVYYSADGFQTQPTSRGVLLSVPRRSGTANPLLLNVQEAGSVAEHWLLAPTADPTAERLAFIEIVETWSPHQCPVESFSLSCVLDETAARRPPLNRIAVRVRDVEATGTLDGDPTLMIDLRGVTIVSDSGMKSIVHNYPFQRLFAEERATAVRASWAPDGERLVLSDGLQLLIWTVGADSAEAVPNTEDGAWPAWSPDGEWIAFTRLQRADSTGTTCTYHGDFGVLTCTQERTDYSDGRHVLSLVRPDGSDPQDLGDGDTPAWSPDGAQLYFSRDGRIWRSGLGESTAVAINGTEGGHEPAAAPDGRYLAFSKLSAAGDWDIWIVLLEP